jgi:probable HAF family extracellular repeat protein
MKSRIMMWTIAVSLFTALAMPVCMTAQDASTPDHHHRHHTYTLVDLGTFGGANSYPIIVESVQTLSQSGVVAGCADTTQPNPKYPNFNPFLFPPPQPDPAIAHGFRSSHDGSLRDLGALPGTNNSCALWISDNGLIAGASENGLIDPLTGWPEIEAVFWKNNHLTRLGTLGGYESFPISVNNRGQVAGAATNTVPEDNGFGTEVHAFLWQDGIMRDLGTLPGGSDSFAVIVNDRGQVMGGSSALPQPGSIFLWEHGTMQEIPNTIGGTMENPFYMNNQTMILGNASIAGDMAFHPFFWYRGVMTDIGTFGGDNGDAVWVNERGQVVGTADFPGDVIHHAFLWRRGHKIDLGTLSGDLCSQALSINSNGQIAGRSSDCVNGSAVLWDQGMPTDLNQLVESPSGLTLIRAWNINERGEIVAEGLLSNGDEHAVLLVPHGDCDDDCEQRLAQSQRNGTVIRPPRLQSGYNDDAPMSPAQRVRSMMGQRSSRPRD